MALEDEIPVQDPPEEPAKQLEIIGVVVDGEHGKALLIHVSPAMQSGATSRLPDGPIRARLEGKSVPVVRIFQAAAGVPPPG